MLWSQGFCLFAASYFHLSYLRLCYKRERILPFINGKHCQFYYLEFLLPFSFCLIGESKDEASFRKLDIIKTSMSSQIAVFTFLQFLAYIWLTSDFTEKGKGFWHLWMGNIERFTVSSFSFFEKFFPLVLLIKANDKEIQSWWSDSILRTMSFTSKIQFPTFIWLTSDLTEKKETN